MGIFTGADLKKYSLIQLAEKFGKFGRYIYYAVRGEDNRPVKASHDFQDNLELSSKRSLSAIRVLNKAGVPFDMMRIGGYGETDKNKVITEKDRRKYDRKIVLVVEPLDSTERGFPKEVL